MNFFKKTTTCLALSAAMIGGLAMTQEASALPVPAPGGPGGAYINPNGLGQALAFPYYTVRDGQRSLFNITNTTDKTVAIKVRFREGLNSRDALDFNVILSPYDVWTAYVTDGGDAPIVKSDDNSCVIGAPDIHTTGQKLSAVGYNDAASYEDQGPNSIQRTYEGYVEVVTMGISDLDVDNYGTVPYFAKHDEFGMPRDCDEVNKAFIADADTTFPVNHPFIEGSGNGKNGHTGNGAPLAAADFDAAHPGQNPLKGNFSLIKNATGIGAGTAAVAIADWMDYDMVHATTAGSLITAQNFPYFYEPTLASREGLWSTTGLANVEMALASNKVINEWSYNPDNGGRSDWVVTFITKNFHVDHLDKDGFHVENNIQAGWNQWRVSPGVVAAAAADCVAGPNVACTDGELIGIIFEDNFNAYGAKVSVGLTGYDREEWIGYDDGDTNPSPMPPDEVKKAYLNAEANVVSFTPKGDDSALQAENYVLNVSVDSLLYDGASKGWASLDLLNTTPTKSDDDYGFPSVGYIFKLRDSGEANANYGQIMDHAWGNINPCENSKTACP